MFTVVKQSENLSRKKLADKNLGMSYHERLVKSKSTNNNDNMFFQVDCENGYSRFQLFEENITNN